MSRHKTYASNIIIIGTPRTQVQIEKIMCSQQTGILKWLVSSGLHDKDMRVMTKMTTTWLRLLSCDRMIN